MNYNLLDNKMTNKCKSYIVYEMEFEEKILLHNLVDKYELVRDIILLELRPPKVYYPYLDDSFSSLVNSILKDQERMPTISHYTNGINLPYSLAEEIDWREVLGDVSAFFALLKRLDVRYVSSDDLFEMDANSHDAIVIETRELYELVHKQKSVRLSQELEPQPTTIKLEPRSYDQASAVLNFSGHLIKISRQKNMLGKQDETREAYLMRRLFKDVNTMRSGVSFKSSTRSDPFNSGKLSPAEVKKVKNYIASINLKVSKATGVDTLAPLIIYNQKAFMVNSLYL